MKKYYYSLDDKKRINSITDVFIDYYKEIELTEEEFNSIVMYETGIIDQKLIYIGTTNDEDNKNNLIKKVEKIQELKYLLTNTDYQIIKCYEAFMRQLPLPYNLEELATQRDAWRAEINQLETELEAL